MTPRIFRFALAGSLVLLSAPRAVPAAGLVNLSRVMIRSALNVGQSEVHSIAGARMQEFCADEDGCLITLRMEDAGGFEASQWHLLYRTLSGAWKTENSNGTDASAPAAQIGALA